MDQRVDSAVSATDFSKSIPATSSTSRLEALMASLTEFSLRDSIVPGTPGSGINEIHRKASHDSAMSGVPVFSRRGSSSASVGSARKRSKSVSRLSEDTIQAITLGQLQGGQSTMSALLFKLNAASPAPSGPDKWKLRFFVLDHQANLYIFKANPHSQSLPITFLPVSACSVAFDEQENSWLLCVSGDGIGAGGQVVQRKWVVKFGDEETVGMWAKRIHRVVGGSGGGGGRGENASSLPRSERSGTSIHSNSGVGGGFESQHAYGISQQEYLRKQQMMALERHRLDQMQRWAEEDRARADLEKQLRVSKDVEVSMMDRSQLASEALRAKEIDRKTKEKADKMKALMGLY
ncbi:hypothetical protein HDU98_011557 [Podochytrium sp. JEL0797]|nr:hypothetical protein HDU98_011557 [Podochytrium sp. JEL0797]